MRLLRALLLCFAFLPAVAQAQVALAPLAIEHFVDNNGNACVGCKLFTYQAGTTIKQATYTDSGGGTQQTNPVIMNSRGEPENTFGNSTGIWLSTGVSYKFVFAPANDTDPPTNPFWTVDNIPGGFSNSIVYPNPTVVNDVVLWGDTTGSTFLDAGTKHWIVGNQTPSPGVAMKIDNLFEVSASYPLVDEAGIWPGANTYTFLGVSKEITSADITGTGPVPITAFFSYTNTTIAGADAVALMQDCVARVNSSHCWGGNQVTRSGGGAITVKLVGDEIDQEFIAGDMPTSDSGGLFINTFNGNLAGGNGPAIQLGGFSGVWTNGIGVAAVQGAGLFVANNYSGINSLVNTTSSAGFGQDAIIVGNGGSGASNGQAILFSGTSTSGAIAFEDGSNNFYIRNLIGNVQLDAETGHAVLLGVNGGAAAEVVAGASITSGNTTLYLAYNNGSLQALAPVSLGAADSGGTGYKLLRLPN